MRAWEEFLASQEKDLGADTVKKWLRSLKILRFDACNLYLEAGDSFQALWFEEHVRSRLQGKFLNKNNKKIKVHLSVSSTPVPTEPSRAPAPKKEAETSSSTPLQPFSLRFDELDPHLTFESFLPSESNRLAHEILLKLVENPSEQAATFNPVFLYGASGVGKTHLLMAAAHRLRQKGLTAIYARAETFTDHVIRAIRAGEMQVFRKAYRNADVLLIDDVQVFSRKGATQEELFHTFNTLHVEGRPLILSANCAPGELTFIEPRLISRFEWGIVLPLESSPRDLLKSMLAQRAQMLKFPIREEVIQFLVNAFTSNTKAVYRALEALILRNHLNLSQARPSQNALSLDEAKGYVADLLHEEKRSILTPEKIVETVALFYGIQSRDVLGKSQKREASLPRQIAMFLCRTQLALPFVKIGDIFSRDHSTVMTSIRQIQNGIADKQGELSAILNSLTKRLR
jgi:chromosomal replication initiator protein